MSQSKPCKKCFMYFQVYYLIEIDNIKVGDYCNVCAGDVCDGLKQRFGWLPEVYRSSYHDCYKMTNTKINNLIKKVEVLY